MILSLCLGDTDPTVFRKHTNQLQAGRFSALNISLLSALLGCEAIHCAPNVLVCNWQANFDEMEAGNANWQEKGNQMQAKFDETATCAEPTLYNGMEFYRASVAS